MKDRIQVKQYWNWIWSLPVPEFLCDTGLITYALPKLSDLAKLYA